MRLNNWQFVGNLGRDPEQRYTQAGDPVYSINVAVNVSRKRGDEWEQNTLWARVTAFGARYEWMMEKLSKGSSVYVSGRLDVSEWESREGEKRYSIDVFANDVQELFRPPREGSASNGQDHWGTGATSTGRPSQAGAGQPRPTPASRPAPAAAPAEDDPDLPF